MNILAFDTSFDACSVAVRTTARASAADEPSPRCANTEMADFSETVSMQRGHAEALLPMIDRVMARAGLTFGKLDRIVVTHGPGTFTGSRIAIAAAQGLAMRWNTPIVTCSSFLAIARAVSTEQSTDVIIVARDARRGSIYAQLFDRSGRELSEPALMTPEAAAMWTDGQEAVIVGSGSALVSEAIQQNSKTVVHSVSQLNAEAEARHLLDIADTLEVTQQPRPLYLRPPDATPQEGVALPRA